MTFPHQPPAAYRTIEGVTERRCNGCGMWIPFDLEHFGRHGNPLHKTGLQPRCKPCQRTADAARHRARYHAYARRAA